jgi:hypothetical protein
METYAVVVWQAVNGKYRKASGFVNRAGLDWLLDTPEINLLFSPVPDGAFSTLQAGAEGGRVSFWDEGAVYCDPDNWISADVQGVFDERYPAIGPVGAVSLHGALYFT